MTWYIVQTNPNCETKAVAEIRRAGFRAYLPKMAREFRHHRTKQPGIKRTPALVGYVFMRFPDGRPNWYALRQCQGVKGILYSDGRPYSLQQAAVASIMRAQRSMAFDTSNARQARQATLSGERHALAKGRFMPGRHVAATVGPFARIIAKVVRVTERGTVAAIADILGAETPVEFTAADRIEVLDRAAEAA